MSMVRALVMCALVSVCGCSLSDRSIVGTYVSDSDGGDVVVEINSDGTFSQFKAGRELCRGRWHMNASGLLSQSIVLDGSYHLPLNDGDQKLGKGAMEYELMRQGGHLCLDVNQDLIQWCRKAPGQY